MRYYKDRSEAGKILAEKLVYHNSENTSVLCLTEGAILVGVEIAKKLHSSVYLLPTSDLELPGELDPVATMNPSGSITYNQDAYSKGDLEEFNEEYFAFIEQERLEAFHSMNRIISKDGPIPKTLLKNHVLILVSDGFKNGLSLDVAIEFLKPLSIKSLIVACTNSSVKVVDKMHLMADEIVCLNILEDYMSVNHYYENNDIPSHDQAIQLMKNSLLQWQ